MPPHSDWEPLSCTPVVLTLVGAAAAARMPFEAAELAYRIIEAAYRSTDSRAVDQHGGVPGFTREYHAVNTTGKWGASEYADAGIEGYGWGALGVHLLIRHLLGPHEEEAGVIKIAPVLPQVLRRVGAIYRVGPVPWGKYLLYMVYAVRDAGSYSMQVRYVVRTVLEALQEVVEQQWA